MKGATFHIIGRKGMRFITILYLKYSLLFINKIVCHREYGVSNITGTVFE